jgi:predicted kinase
MSGSGKSTYGNNLCKEDSSFIHLNRDNLRFTLFGVDGWDEYKFTKDREEFVTEAFQALVICAAVSGKNIVCSDTNLNPRFRNKLIAFIKGAGYTVEIKEFDVSLRELLERNKHRGVYKLPEDVILKQHEQWLEYKGE